MESKKPVLKNERELKQEEEKRDKSVQERDGTVTELERLKNIEKTQLSVSQIQKISKLRGQIANQEMMIEKMRRENEKLKDRTRIYSSSHMDPELEMAMRMSELENSHAYRAPTGLNEAEIDVISS